MLPQNDYTTEALTFADRALTQVLPVFARLACDYVQAHAVRCVLADPEGNIVVGGESCGEHCVGGRKCMDTRRQAIAEAVRWGEPHILLCPNGIMIWAVPVMQNAAVLGGLIAAAPQAGAEDGFDPTQVYGAAMDLLQRAEAANLTNPAHMKLQREAARRESEKAQAIHAVKEQDYHSIRELYLVEEPELIAAVKRGDRPAAREIINRLLVGIYFASRSRPLLLKSFLLELVVTLSRAAVEAGADPTELLGANYSHLHDLARIDGEEELTAWLVSMLESTMEAISAHHRYPVSVLLSEAIRYLREHSGEDLSRDDIARRACLSPTHFSRVVKQTFGHSFTELLARLRVDRAREMLTHTEKTLVEISGECGFTDQSYFTKVFQKYTGQTPGEYRRQHQKVG
jgi:AraC-like DNA-binding protein